MKLSAINKFIDQNQHRLLAELQEFLRIPSISTLPEHRPDIDRAAAFIANSLESAGLQKVRCIETNGHPIVYAEWLHAPGKPTVLCYGHYDVQPIDPLEEWNSPPFEPTIREGNIYCRGSADDKGQMYMHVKAIETLRAIDGKLPLNVKFLIEGEEEIGGRSVSYFVRNNAEMLSADVALVSDTEMYASEMPTICTGLRGLVYMEVECEGPRRDLHSGTFGGASPNPLFGLIQLLAKVKDSSGVIRVPRMYDSVRAPSTIEKQMWSQLPFDEADFLCEIGVPNFVGEPGYTVLERLWSRPTFEVHGISGGFSGAGAKTVIPAKAVAKVSFRLVPDQDPQAIVESFQSFINDHVPSGTKVNVRTLSASPGLVVDIDHPAIRVAVNVLTDIFKRPTVFTREGGSIPIVGDFARYLNIPTILMGFGLPDDGLHSPNEKFNLGNYYQGIRAIAHFFDSYASSV